MQKTLISSILVLLAVMSISLSSVLAADLIDIVQPTIPVSGTSGVATGTFTVNNVGTTTYSVTFGVSILSDGNGNILFVNLPADIASLAPSQLQTTSFTVNITNALAGIYNGILTAVGGSAFDTARIQTTVLSNGLGVIQTAGGLPSNTSNPGTTVSNSVKIKNQRNSKLFVNVAGAIFGTTFVNQTINVSAFTEVPFAFSIPIPTAQPAGTYAGSLNFMWDTGSLTIPFQVVVNPIISLRVPSSVSSGLNLGETVVQPFSITNTGNDNATFNLSLNQAGFTDNDGDLLNVTMSPAKNIALLPGDTKVIVLTIAASSRVDPGTYTGAIKVTGNTIDLSIPVSITINNILEITDITVSSPGSERRVKPGEQFTVKVKYGNIANDIDLEDMNVRVELRDGTRLIRDDNGDPLDDDVNVNDLNAGDRDDVTLTFTTPFSLDNSDKFDVIAEVTGKNKDDRSQTFNATQTGDTITVDRKLHEIELFDVRMTNAILSCDRQTTLEVGARDIGRDDEDVQLTVTNAALGFDSSDSFQLSHNQDDNNFEVIRRFPIDAQNAQPGQYLIAVTAKYDRARTATQVIVPVTVTQCSEPLQLPATGSKSEPIVVQSSNQDQKVPSPSPYFSARKLTSQSSWMLWVLIGANVLILLILLAGYKMYKEL